LKVNQWASHVKVVEGQHNRPYKAPRNLHEARTQSEQVVEVDHVGSDFRQDSNEQSFQFLIVAEEGIQPRWRAADKAVQRGAVGQLFAHRAQTRRGGGPPGDDGNRVPAFYQLRREGLRVALDAGDAVRGVIMADEEYTHTKRFL
jgi:hypothetical protein